MGKMNSNDFIGKRYVTNCGAEFIIKDIVPRANVSDIPDSYCFEDGMAMIAVNEKDYTMPLHTLNTGYGYFEITDENIEFWEYMFKKYEEIRGSLHFRSMYDIEVTEWNKKKEPAKKPEPPKVEKKPEQKVQEGEQMKLF